MDQWYNWTANLCMFRHHGNLRSSTTYSKNVNIKQKQTKQKDCISAETVHLETVVPMWDKPQLFFLQADSLLFLRWL